jgi:hypothetical protein
MVCCLPPQFEEAEGLLVVAEHTKQHESANGRDDAVQASGSTRRPRRHAV